MNLYTKARKLYQRLDETIDNHYASRKKKPPCSKGCASCCSQFFEVSELEYSLIFEYLMKLPEEERAAIGNKATILFEAFKDHWTDFYTEFFKTDPLDDTNRDMNAQSYYDHPERFSVVLPCVFLADDGSCQIYDTRPTTCRTTGVGFLHHYNPGAVCNYIKCGLLTPFWQADLRALREDIDSIKWIESTSNNIGFKRQYPLFFYVYDSIARNRTNDYADIARIYKTE